MRSLTRVPEIWPSPSQYRRPCQGTTYIHPATERTPQMHYDNFGYCDPTMVQPSGGVVTQIVEKTPSWVYYIVIGGVVYLAWKYRKKLKKVF